LNHLDPEDDMIAMERSTLRTFIGPGQLATLLESWYRQELQDNTAFLEKFAPSLLVEEEGVIGLDEYLYGDEEEDNTQLPDDGE